MLEAAPGEMTAERSALLAHHFARGDDRAKAVEALLRAGLQAEALPSYRTAVDFFRRAWEIADAELANAGGRNGDAFLRAALEATTGIARLCALFGAFPGRRPAAARRGRELAEALGDTETLANLCYFHGVLVMQGGEEEFARGLALAEEGMALAQRSGVPRAPLRISRGLAISYAHDGRFDLARRAIDWVGEELAREGLPPDSDLVLSTRWVRGAVLYMADDLDAAAEDLGATYALAKRAPNHTMTGGSASTLAQVHFLRGAYAEALRWADESLEVGEAIGNLALFPGSAAVALAARHELGEPAHTERYLDLLEQGIAVGTTVQMHVRFLADGLRVVDDPDRIARLAGQLAACPAGGRLRELLAATALGELWARVGRLAEAERRFARAMALAEAIGHRSGLAAAALGAADVALRRGDGAAAERLRARALTLARALRLGRFLARAERLT
jgi:tetratricopeptide (TPR) repeat protein